MEPKKHIICAAGLFATGQRRYWARPGPRGLTSFHNALRKAARRLGFRDWRFVEDQGAVMIVPYQKGQG